MSTHETFDEHEQRARDPLAALFGPMRETPYDGRSIVTVLGMVGTIMGAVGDHYIVRGRVGIGIDPNRGVMLRIPCAEVVEVDGALERRAAKAPGVNFADADALRLLFAARTRSGDPDATGSP